MIDKEVVGLTFLALLVLTTLIPFLIYMYTYMAARGKGQGYLDTRNKMKETLTNLKQHGKEN